MKINEKAVQNVLLVIILLTMGFVLGLMVASFQEADAADMADISKKVKPSLLKSCVMSYSVEWDEPITRTTLPHHNRTADISELPYTEEELEMLAKTVWGEACGCSPYEQRLVVWCVLNRLDMGIYGETIAEVITAPKQFYGYRSGFPVTDVIKEQCVAVLEAWMENDARELPLQYVNFLGDGLHNHFYDRDGIYFN